LLAVFSQAGQGWAHEFPVVALRPAWPVIPRRPFVVLFQKTGHLC
jgi:hypothetical protein